MRDRLAALVSRLRLACSRRRMDEETRRECETHLGLLVERYVRHGMTLEAARRAARRQFGSPLLVREHIHEMNGVAWADALWRDTCFSARQLTRSPGFTALATITLALGIGANSAIFALVDAALIRPLPFPQPDRLVMLWEWNGRTARGLVAPLNFHDWEERASTFDGLAAVYNYARRLTASDGTVDEVAAQQVTPRFFDLLGAHPILGRLLLPSDVAVPPNVVVLSEGLWRARFGGDPAVVGGIIRLDAQPFTVVGVVADGFQAMPPASLWTVWAELPGMDSRANRFMRVVGRLKPGASLAAAQKDVQRVAAELAREYPRTNADTSVTIEPLRDALVGREVKATSVLFLAVVGFVLLMCCANVASLMLANGRPHAGIGRSIRARRRPAADRAAPIS
jgi:putative ABC transport system permease protein